MGVTKQKTESKFTALAQQVCNGCDLITSEENKLSTGDVIAAGVLTLDDFAICEIEGKRVGVVTFVEMPGRYYWGGLSLTNMVVSFADACGSIDDARIEYAAEKTKVRLQFEASVTKNKQSFTKVTVLD